MLTDECRSGDHDNCTSSESGRCICMHHHADGMAIRIIDALRAIRADTSRGVRAPVGY